MQIKMIWLLFLLFANFGTSLAQNQVCQCKDTGDLLRRIVVANAAIEAYQNEIVVMKAQEARDGKTLGYTKERYAKLQYFVAQNILQHQNWSGGHNETAKTNVACEVDVPSTATPCIEASLRVHEEVHQKSCKAKKSNTDFLTWKMDWKQKMTLVEVAQEEIQGYTTELAFLNAQLKSAYQNCNIGDNKCHPPHPFSCTDQRTGKPGAACCDDPNQCTYGGRFCCDKRSTCKNGHIIPAPPPNDVCSCP